MYVQPHRPPGEAGCTGHSAGAQCVDIPQAEPCVEPSQESRTGPEAYAPTA